MELSDLITPESIICPLRANSKKQVLMELAQKAGDICGLNARDVFDTILQRERLGSTGIGHGVAIPHGKMDGLARICGVTAKLATPVDFDSVDEEPVDIVFMLLAPEGAGADHLKALARVSRLVKTPALLEKLRSAKDAATIFALLTETTSSQAA